MKIKGTRVGAGPTTPTPPGPGTWPAWREAIRGLGLNKSYPIAHTSTVYQANNYGFMAAAVGNEINNVDKCMHCVDGWSSITVSPNAVIWSALGGGEDWGWNPVISLNLYEDAPRWVCNMRSSHPSVFDYTRTSPRYADDKPGARHTYDSIHFVQGIHLTALGDSQDRVMLFSAFAAYGAHDGGYGSGPETEAFVCSDNIWDPAYKWSSAPSDGTKESFGGFCGHATDPRDSKHYYTTTTTDGTFRACLNWWDPATNLWNATGPIITSPNYPSDGGARLGNPFVAGLVAIIDTTRNEYVHVNGGFDGNATSSIPHPRVQRTNLTTGVTTNVPLVDGGAAPVDLAGYEAGLTHDLDNDRYILFPFGSDGLSGVGSVWSIHPTSGVTTKLSNASFTPPSTVESNTYWIYNRAHYIQSLGGIVVLSHGLLDLVFIPTRDAP